MGQFSWAVVSQDDEPQSSAKAQEAIRRALDASQLLAAAYAEQVIAARRRGGGKLPSLLGASSAGPPLDDASAKAFLAAFNAALVPICWRRHRGRRRRFLLVRLRRAHRLVPRQRPEGLRRPAGATRSPRPARLGLPLGRRFREPDGGRRPTSSARPSTRYRGKVDYWLCAARANTSEVLSLSEEEQLRLAAGSPGPGPEARPRHADGRLLDQPWGEYMGRRPVDSPPLGFADALVRAGLDLRALMLEMNLGCFRGGTLPPTELDLSRKLDHLEPAGPAAAGLAEHSRRRRRRSAGRSGGSRLRPGTWTPGNPAGLGRPLRAADAGQARRAGRLLEPAPRQPAARFSRTPASGTRGAAKPALRTLAAIRAACLPPPR